MSSLATIDARGVSSNMNSGSVCRRVFSTGWRIRWWIRENDNSNMLHVCNVETGRSKTTYILQDNIRTYSSHVWHWHVQHIISSKKIEYSCTKRPPPSSWRVSAPENISDTSRSHFETSKACLCIGMNISMTQFFLVKRALNTCTFFCACVDQYRKVVSFANLYTLCGSLYSYYCVISKDVVSVGCCYSEGHWDISNL